MKLKSYKFLFSLFSFLSDRTNGKPLFVKYKILLGTLIIGLIGSSGCKSSKKEVACYVQPAEPPVENVTCYKPTMPTTDDREVYVKGRVIDESGEPIYGTTVSIKKRRIGVITDDSGSFSIKARVKDKLEFFFIGFERQEIPVSKMVENDGLVVMKEQDAVLCYEVVVTRYSPSKISELSYKEVEVPPVSPVGDLDKFCNWMENNIRYSDKMLEDKIEGQLILRFSIDKKGEIADQRILSKLSPEADSEALRVLSTSDVWKAGIHNGKAIKTIITIPVYFKLP